MYAKTLIVIGTKNGDRSSAFRRQAQKDNPAYKKLEHLAGLQARFSEENFLKISRFL